MSIYPSDSIDQAAAFVDPSWFKQNDEPTQYSWLQCDYATPTSPASTCIDSSPSPKGDSTTATDVLSPSSSRSRPRSPNRIPRPRNAFMIFRSAFLAEDKINRTVEHDHRLISRIIAHCWNDMSDEDKVKWRAKADAEKAEHARKYPGYRFTPNPKKSARKPVRRNVKRNGSEELERCRHLAELIQAGKKGAELQTAVQERMRASGGAVAKKRVRSQAPVPQSKSRKRASSSANTNDPPIFRSPLLPPSETGAQHVPSLDLSASVAYPTDGVLPPVETPFSQFLPSSSSWAELIPVGDLGFEPGPVEGLQSEIAHPMASQIGYSSISTEIHQTSYFCLSPQAMKSSQVQSDDHTTTHIYSSHAVYPPCNSISSDYAYYTQPQVVISDESIDALVSGMFTGNLSSFDWDFAPSTLW